MIIRSQLHYLELVEPFGISRSTYSRSDSTFVRIDGGWGEAVSSTYFGENEESVAGALERLAQLEPGDLDAVEDVWDAMAAAVPGQMCAKCAVDVALYDRLGKKLGVPLWKLLARNPPRRMVTSYTVGIAPPADMLRKAEQAMGFAKLKIKLGRNVDTDMQVMREIRRAVGDKPLFVDANAGWSLDDARRAVRELADLGIEYVEQPLRKGALDELRKLKAESPLPIFVDEDSMVSADLPALAGITDGINIKLMKCGGITEARRMIALARAYGMRTMLGGRVESSVAVTAAAHLASHVDFLDLDGNLLASNDPFVGVQTAADGTMTMPSAPGLGVGVRPEYAELFSDLV